MLILICGIPNAGKTTYSKQFKNVLHQDDIGTIDNIVNRIKQIDGDVIIEGYFGTSEIRKQVLSAYHGNANCIFIDISIEESIQRESRHRHPSILRNASMRFETPSLNEGWNKIIIIKGDNYVKSSSK